MQPNTQSINFKHILFSVYNAKIKTFKVDEYLHDMEKEKERKHRDQFMQKVAQAKMAEEIEKMEKEMEGKSYDEIHYDIKTMLYFCSDFRLTAQRALFFTNRYWKNLGLRGFSRYDETGVG